MNNRRILFLNVTSQTNIIISITLSSYFTYLKSRSFSPAATIVEAVVEVVGLLLLILSELGVGRISGYSMTVRVLCKTGLHLRNRLFEIKAYLLKY